MGWFDFLKRKSCAEPPLDPGATLEALLGQAAADPAYRPEFYRRLLLEELVVITDENPATLVPGTSIADGSTTMRIFCWEDGRIPVFTTPDRIFDGEVIKHRVAYAQMKGRALFETLPGATLVLNPYSASGKELLPDEVVRILAGTVLDTGQTLVAQPAAQVLLGHPAVYPTEMVRALARLLAQQPRVVAAYLGWIHDPAGPVPPHYIFCLDVEGEMTAIAKETGFVAQQFLDKGALVDIVQADKSSLTDYFRSTKPFYER
ncbi:enhanced serine sensitivity protein SseB C-terminal domain-containing protein [Hymenobacter nivis]|uniref:Enhanced serine sensitivity protein SseB n=1 Tax=Hymenobacter nivis TaxID=1850093 RepID=A0A2Z3GEZ1_9BACT|nr:enhanced serine sensitivity protein SseB C-terminal domain-containing protein [Hymenobacter nivis]AWM32279.1 hypothetical protein DDQ68_05410 [Hymenobacter nivis]